MNQKMFILLLTGALACAVVLPAAAAAANVQPAFPKQPVLSGTEAPGGQLYAMVGRPAVPGQGGLSRRPELPRRQGYLRPGQGGHGWAEENGMLSTERDVVWRPDEETGNSLYPQAQASWDFVSAVLDTFSVK